MQIKGLQIGARTNQDGHYEFKLEEGEYRSAQAMQKDFILIMQNCRTFNADSSDIVREARAQHLLRPKFLREAAASHNLFLAEDGSVLEMEDEKLASAKKKGKKAKTDDVDDEKDGAVQRKRPPRRTDREQAGQRRRKHRES